MNRRTRYFRFWTLTLSSLLVGLCFMDACYAQSTGLRRIGVVAVSVSEQSEEASSFRAGLQDAGYVEGRDISIEWWYGHSSYQQVDEGLASILQHKPEVIVVEGSPAALAAKRATTKIPIVMALVGDPVGIGVIQSLGHPGGNITGLTNETVDLVTKRLQLLHEALPKATRILVPYNPDTPFSPRYLAALKTAAPQQGLQLTFTPVRRSQDVPPILSKLRRSAVDVLMPTDDAFMTSKVAEMLEPALKARIPIVYPYKPLARKGVLLSYTVSSSELFRRSAGYVDKILKGTAPADLPVEQPTKFELVINLKTARILALTIPESVVLQADEIIR